MKQLLFILIIAFGSETYGQALTKNDVDEFTGNRIIQSDYVQIDQEGYSGRAFVSAFFSEGDYVFLLTVLSRDSWQLLSTDTAYFIIDGEREQFDLERVSTDVSSGTTTEIYGIFLSESQFTGIANSESVRFRAGGNIFELSEEARNAFTLVLNTLKDDV